jgi:polar amino acid transport system substrate-binding protein
MLQAKRVELTLEDEFVARYHFARELSGIRDELEFLPRPLSENGLHILIRRSHPDHQGIAEAFDRAIVAMRADGSYAAILQRHGL